MQRPPLSVCIAAGIITVLLLLLAWCWCRGNLFPEKRGGSFHEDNVTCNHSAGGGCVLVHRAHSDQDEAAKALTYVKELLLVTRAYLRAKYLSPNDQTPQERTESFRAEIRELRLHSKQLKAKALNKKGRKRVEKSMDHTSRLPPVRERLSTFTANLVDRWNPNNISEGSPHNSTGETAFTENHGTRMVYCLRNKTPGAEILDYSLLGFVALHELTHVITPGFEHPTCFWERFKWILHEMDESGLYPAVDYAKRPHNYCGMDLSHNPLTDSTIRNIWESPPKSWGGC